MPVTSKWDSFLFLLCQIRREPPLEYCFPFFCAIPAEMPMWWKIDDSAFPFPYFQSGDTIKRSATKNEREAADEK
jgi:hypothetical protein